MAEKRSDERGAGAVGRQVEKKKAVNSTKADPEEFGKRTTPARERMAGELKKKSKGEKTNL